MGSVWCHITTDTHNTTHVFLCLRCLPQWPMVLSSSSSSSSGPPKVKDALATRTSPILPAPPHKPHLSLVDTKDPLAAYQTSNPHPKGSDSQCRAIPAPLIVLSVPPVSERPAVARSSLRTRPFSPESQANGGVVRGSWARGRGAAIGTGWASRAVVITMCILPP